MATQLRIWPQTWYVTQAGLNEPGNIRNWEQLKASSITSLTNSSTVDADSGPLPY